MSLMLPQVTTYLESIGIGTQATDLFYGIVPEDPDSITTLFEYAGKISEPDLGGTGGTTLRLEYPRLQVITRGAPNEYDAPRLKLQNVITALAAVVNQTLSGTRYLAFEPRPVSFLQRDENFRVLFVCNLEVTKQYSPT